MQEKLEKRGKFGLPLPFQCQRNAHLYIKNSLKAFHRKKSETRSQFFGSCNKFLACNNLSIATDISISTFKNFFTNITLLYSTW